jgi:hypothetical protein
MIKVIRIANRDFWFKITDFLHQNWAVIEPESNAYRLYFLTDDGDVFDSILFAMAADAEAALRRNDWIRFDDDAEAADFIGPPEPPYRDGWSPRYSLGEYWI